jgi:hypothetical protein
MLLDGSNSMEIESHPTVTILNDIYIYNISVRTNFFDRGPAGPLNKPIEGPLGPFKATIGGPKAP